MARIRISKTMKWALGEPCLGNRLFTSGEEFDVPGPVVGFDLMRDMVQAGAATQLSESPQPKTKKKTTARKKKAMSAPENK